MVNLTQVISQENKQIHYCIRSNLIFLRHFFFLLPSISWFKCDFRGRLPFISALNSYEHMPVWFNEAISDLICQSSDAEKATEREVRPMAVWDRKSRTFKRQETNRALRSAGHTVMPHTNTQTHTPSTIWLPCLESTEISEDQRWSCWAASPRCPETIYQGSKLQQGECVSTDTEIETPGYFNLIYDNPQYPISWSPKYAVV